jgi:hypothetical protein
MKRKHSLVYEGERKTKTFFSRIFASSFLVEKPMRKEKSSSVSVKKTMKKKEQQSHT